MDTKTMLVSGLDICSLSARSNPPQPGISKSRKEDFTDDTGTGVFTLLLKQKKDKMANMKFEGGFSGE